MPTPNDFSAPSDTPTQSDMLAPQDADTAAGQPNEAEQSLADFEQSLEKLEAIVTKMEQGTLSLEQSLSAFEEGVQLTRSCQTSLRNAEQRVSKLVEDSSGLSSTPFNSSDQDQAL